MRFGRRAADPGPRSPGANRAEMDAALRSAVDQHLRPIGFRGSLPHLRRRLADRIDLVSVQHDRSGGSFVVEVACALPTGITLGARVIGPSEIRAQDINDPRPRLGAASFPERGSDHWFVYGPRRFEDPSRDGYARPDDLAAEVISLIRGQAEPWWRTRPFPPGAHVAPAPAT